MLHFNLVRRQSSRSQIYHKLDVLKNFAKVIRNHSARISYIEAAGSACDFINKETPTEIPVAFVKFLKVPFLQNTTG